MEQELSFFQKHMIEKKTQFHERVHAAFVLDTSLNHWGKLSDRQMDWLASAYPETTLEIGTDQGATYTTINPKF